MERFTATINRVLLCVGVACAPACGIALAEDTPVRTFAVWAVGLPNGYVLLEHQARTIDVSDEDARRGVVDVPDGSRLTIVTRSAGGYAVDFTLTASSFRSVRIEGLGPIRELGASGGTLVDRHVPEGRNVVSVGYRFSLVPDTKPGTYAWPLQMAVRRSGPRDNPVANGLTRLLAMNAPVSP